MTGLYEYSSVIVRAALAEDIGQGDMTTAALVSGKAKGAARINAKQDLVLAGLFVAEDVFRQLDKRSVFKACFKDGDRVKKGEVLATVSGSIAALLSGERVALNFLQRLSGIATLTKEFVRRTSGSPARILDTRKTAPCLRMLDKYAVKAGGGHNHRFGLFDSILIKDNHARVSGGVGEAIRKVNKRYKEGVPVEAEVADLKELREALSAGADIIMLDNMALPQIRKAMKMISNTALVEASGGVTLGNVRQIAFAGVDFISVGALTHSAPAADISMELINAGKRKY
ncbi:MAG: carboxylating nicotinate-nucleotide diphosphorylase [Deltaproteobacteria bacterium]|nr:carboxylating nicotinate-nucleotide diphosphorylase [Deltaproteobacteria bacterium]